MGNWIKSWESDSKVSSGRCLISWDDHPSGPAAPEPLWARACSSMPVGHRMFTGVSGTRAPANSELVREAKSGKNARGHCHWYTCTVLYYLVLLHCLSLYNLVPLVAQCSTCSPKVQTTPWEMMYEAFTMDQETLQSPNASVKHQKHGFQFSVMF